MLRAVFKTRDDERSPPDIEHLSSRPDTLMRAAEHMRKGLTRPAGRSGLGRANDDVMNALSTDGVAPMDLACDGAMTVTLALLGGALAFGMMSAALDHRYDRDGTADPCTLLERARS